MKVRTRLQTEGFTLVEVIVALVILGVGVMALMRLFPENVRQATRAEDLTRATLLAREIVEAIKTQGASGIIRPIPNSPEIVPMPGDGIDTDGNAGYLNPSTGRFEIYLGIDLNENQRLDADMDGYPEWDVGQYLVSVRLGSPDIHLLNQLDDDRDGIVDDDGNGGYYDSGGTLQLLGEPNRDYGYDPEFNLDPAQGFTDGVDEEWPNGRNDDDNGILLWDEHGIVVILDVDEDVRLASDRMYAQRNPNTFRWFNPLSPGNGIDDDGDGETPGPQVYRYNEARGGYDWYAVADGLDNNGNGLIDEGIDEEIYNGVDDDNDGLIDEDCRAASYPFAPRKFNDFPIDQRVLEEIFLRKRTVMPVAPPIPQPGDQAVYLSNLNLNSDNRFAWQILAGRVSDAGGDLIDNDGDGLVDEEWRNNVDDDGDGLVDEDCRSHPVRGYRRLTVRITWDGDGDRNRDGFPGEIGTPGSYGNQDFLNAMRVDAVQLGLWRFLGMQARNNLNNFPPPEFRKAELLPYGHFESAILIYMWNRWASDDDMDGFIDEEKLDGLDNDYDGLIDEDTYGSEYLLTTYVKL